MPIQGLPGVFMSITDMRRLTRQNVYNTSLFILKGQDGFITDVTETKTGTGTVTVTSTSSTLVYADMDIQIKMTLIGDPGVAKFVYSIDGGVTWSTELLTHATDPVYIDNGVSVTFGGTAFVVDDLYEFSTKAGVRKQTMIELTARNYQNIITHKESREYLDAFFEDASRCYVICPPNDVAGSIGADTGTSTGDGTVSVSGDPSQSVELKLEIIESGDIGVGTYIYYIDGVQQNLAPLTLQDEAYIDSLNVLLEFTDGTDPSFVAGDTHIWQLTSVSCSNVLTAITDTYSLPTPLLFNSVKESPLFASIIIPEPLPSITHLNKLKLLVDQRFDSNNFTEYVIQAPDWEDGETRDDYKSRLISYFSYFYDYRCAITVDWYNPEGSTDGNLYIPATVLLARYYALRGVSIDPGQYATESLPINNLYREDDMREIGTALNNAGLIIIRYTNNGNEFAYLFQNSHVKSEPTSSFIHLAEVRAFHKALYITTFELYKLINSKVRSITDSLLSGWSQLISNRVKDLMTDEINDYSFEIITTAEEYYQQPIDDRYFNCRSTVNTVEYVKKFYVTATKA